MKNSDFTWRITIVPKHKIPVTLSEFQFNEFILPHIPVHTFGPQYKISRYKMFRYVMYLLYTGCQWHMIPIEKDQSGKPEIHYTQIFKVYQKCVEWQLEFPSGDS